MSSGKNFADVVRSVYVTQLFSLNSEVEKSSFVLIVVLAIENPFHALSIDNISGQLGCSPATLTRSIARFKTLAGLNSAAVFASFGPVPDYRMATSRRRFKA
jgi:hypothetical protein